MEPRAGGTHWRCIACGSLDLPSPVAGTLKRRIRLQVPPHPGDAALGSAPCFGGALARWTKSWLVRRGSKGYPGKMSGAKSVG